MELTEALYGAEGGSSPVLWLDHWRYTRRLLLQGEPIPWSQATAFDGYFRKADGLLDPDVTVFAVADLLDAHLESAPELRAEMGSKKRTGFAAKTLLRSEVLRQRVAQCLELMTRAASHKPVVLSTPSPRGLAVWAYERAHGKVPEEITVDLADSVAMYLSDFLSSLGETALAAVMVEEEANTQAELAQYEPVYSSVRNVCSHQRWQLGLRVAGPFTVTDVFDFVVVADIADDPGSRAARGVWLPDRFWEEESLVPSLPEARLYYGEVPTEANPERVLQNRQRLRNA